MKKPLMFCLAALGSATLLAQDTPLPSGFPADDSSYASTYRPILPTPAPDMRVKDDPRARREWMRERMGGPLSAAFRDSMIAQGEALRSAYARGAVKPSAGSWVNVGPTGSNWIQNGVQLTKSDTGRVRTILVHPSNPDIVYVLTSGGGLWKTSNFTAPVPIWAAKSDSILGVAGGSVAFGSNPNVLYLGSGDPFDGGVGGFVSKSTDGGDTWGAPKPIGIATTIEDIKVDTSATPEVVLVATNGGLFRSTDGGATYVPAGSFATNGGHFFWSLAQTSAGWLATFEDFFTGQGKVYRSTDRGATWVPAMTGLSGIGRSTLGVGQPGDPVAYLFAATSNDGKQKDLYRSADGGQTWTALDLASKTPVNPNEDQPNMDIMQDQAFYNHNVLVDPTDASRNTVFIGGQFSSAKSTDGGATWRIVTHWLAQYGLPYVHADHHASAFVAQTRTIIFGTDGGLFTSSDGGRTWSDSKNSGIASYLVYALATNEKHNDDVIIGLQDNGTRVRVGQTQTYNQVFGGDGFGVGWGDGYSLGSIYYSFIIRNPNGTPATQQKWQVGWNGIDDTEFFNPKTTQFFTTIYQPSRLAVPEGTTYFHRTKRTLYKTTNSAALWTPIYRLPATVAGEFRGVTHPIGTGFDNLDEIAVAMSAGRVAISTDGGETFRIENLNAPRIPGFATFAAAVAWARPNELYLSTENPDPAAAHLVRSLDGGTTWTRVDGNGLPPVPVSRILVSTRDSSRKTIYVGTWLGVFESTDAGAHWHPLGDNLPLVMVNDLYMPQDGSFLRVGTYGRGIWDYKF